MFRKSWPTLILNIASHKTINSTKKNFTQKNLIIDIFLWNRKSETLICIHLFTTFSKATNYLSPTPLTLTFTVHLYRYFEAPEATLEEPGKAQTDQDVKHIAPHCIGHRHITETCWWNQKHFLTTGPIHIS